MYERQELMDLGERVAEDGVRRHEGAVQKLAAAVAKRLPGAAAVLRDTTAPNVLRERAFSVAADSALRADTAPRPTPWPDEATDSTPAARTEKELERLLLDWRGQLAGWGA